MSPLQSPMAWNSLFVSQGLPWFTRVNQAIMPGWPVRGFERQGDSWAQRAEEVWERSQGK